MNFDVVGRKQLMNNVRIDNHLVNTRTGWYLAETCIISLSFIPKYDGVFGQPVFHQLKVSYNFIFPTEMIMFRGGMVDNILPRCQSVATIALTVRVSFAVTVILRLLSALKFSQSEDIQTKIRCSSHPPFRPRAIGWCVLYVVYVTSRDPTWLALALGKAGCTSSFSESYGTQLQDLARARKSTSLGSCFWEEKLVIE